MKIDFYKCAEPDYDTILVKSIEITDNIDQHVKDWLNQVDGYYYIEIDEKIYDKCPVIILTHKNTCEGCGGYGEEMECPYNREMGGLSHVVVLCDDCKRQRERDV